MLISALDAITNGPRGLIRDVRFALLGYYGEVWHAAIVLAPGGYGTQQ